MPIRWNSDRRKQIENYILGNPSTALDDPPNHFVEFQWKFRGKELANVPVKIGDQTHTADTVFRIDLDYLHYNFQNHRIAIYVNQWQEFKRQRPKDYQSVLVEEKNPEDRAWMEEVLLGKSVATPLINLKSNAPMFEHELIENKQREPAVITVDGTLRNGNRRKAIFTNILRKIKNREKGYADLHEDDFRYLKVIILPAEIEDKDLFDLENFLQTKQDWKQPYDPISILNMVKQAKDDYAMSFEDIQRNYFHNKKISDINLDYEKIKTIDKFLTAIGKEGQYNEVASQQEMFEDYVKFKFQTQGLSAIPKEEAKKKDAIKRDRDRFFFDIVSANACNNDVLRPSEKWIRVISQDVFGGRSREPEKMMKRFYEGIDREMLQGCDPEMIEKFASNVVSNVNRYQTIKLERAPGDKLRRIADDIMSFDARDLDNLSTKNETNKQLGRIRLGVGRIEKAVEQHHKKG